MKSKEKNTGRKPLKIFGVEFVYLFLLGIGIAFFGWVFENLFKFVVSGKFDSRFHILPFISPYALIPFAFHIVLGNSNDLTFFGKKIFKKENIKTKIISNVAAYLFVCAFVFFGELAVGNMWDALFGVELWNYTRQAFNFTKYTCPLSTFGFGTIAYIFFKFVYTPLLNLIRRKVKLRTARIICMTLGVLMIADTVRMMLSIMILGEAPIFWRFYDGRFHLM